MKNLSALHVCRLFAAGLLCVMGGCQSSNVHTTSAGIVMARTLRYGTTPSSQPPTSRDPSPIWNPSTTSRSETSEFFGTIPYDTSKRLYVKVTWIVAYGAQLPKTWLDVSKNVELLVSERLEAGLGKHDAANPLTEEGLRQLVLGSPEPEQPSVKTTLKDYGIVILAEKFVVTRIQTVNSSR